MRRVDPRKPSRAQFVWLIAAASGLAGAAADVTPSAFGSADAVIAGLFAAGVSYAGSRARRWSWLVAVTVAALAAPNAVARATAFAALVVVFAEVVLERRDRVLGALVSAIAVQVLLRLDDLGPNAGSAMVTCIGTVPVLVSGYVNARTRERRIVRRAVAAAVVVVLIITLGFAYGALDGARQLQAAVSAGETGIDALEEGNTEEAATMLDRAALLSEKAGDSFDNPFSSLARALPVVGHHVVATQNTAEASRRVARAAAFAADQADYRSLAITDGTVDLVALAEMREPSATAADALDEAGVLLDGIPTRWLVPPLADPIRELSESLGEARPKAHVAADAIAAAPDMLGASGPRRYFLALGSPAESRGLGGFMGYYGILVADGGRIELVEHGRTGPLEGSSGWQQRTLSGPEDFLRRYWRYQPARYLRNATASPDFPTTAEVLAELYPQTGGQPIDGAVYMDAYALAGLLELSGPIDTGSLQLEAETLPGLLLRDQYALFPDRSERTDLLGDAATAIVDGFLALDRVEPGEVGRVFGPLLAERRLMLESLREAERAVLAAAEVSGEFPSPDGTDFLSVRTANAGENKLDTYLHRTIEYDALVTPGTGEVTSVLTIDLFNGVPSLDLGDYVVGNRAARLGHAAPPPGTSLVWLTIYSPLGVTSAMVDGEEILLERDLELGWNAYSARVDIPPGETVTVEIGLEGYSLREDGYRLAVRPQPLVNADEVTVRVSSTEGSGQAITRRATSGGDVDEGFANSSRDLEVVAMFD